MRMPLDLKARVLAAARADNIPGPARKGLWGIRKFALKTPITVPRGEGKQALIPPGQFTQLFRWTTHSIMHDTPDLVMQDTPDELKTHLNFMLNARGRVLITGLGLGCVARGCLANPAVQSVSVIERDKRVIALVAPYMPGEITIVQADAVEWVKRNESLMTFDCAWHDLWSDPDAGERHLQASHSELFCLLAKVVKFQGAWAFPRPQKRLWNRIAGVAII